MELNAGNSRAKGKGTKSKIAFNAGSSSAKCKGRGKGVQGDDIIEITKQTRDPNFTDDETSLLLCALDMAKDLYGLKNYSFKKSEWKRVEALYNDRATSKRTAEVLKNRWKTLRSDFAVLKALTQRSGWGWASQEHVPIPPSEEEWIALVKGDPKKYGEFKSKKFPWFDQLEKMCGKDVATGYGQVTTESSHQIRHEWYDGERDEVDVADNYDNGHDTDHLGNDVGI